MVGKSPQGREIITAEHQKQADDFLDRHRPQLQGFLEILAEIGETGDVFGLSLLVSLVGTLFSQAVKEVRTNYIPEGRTN